MSVDVPAQFDQVTVQLGRRLVHRIAAGARRGGRRQQGACRADGSTKHSAPTEV
jgi:hypothetical protein